MILKTLSVRSAWFALGASVAFGVAAASPVAAQRPAPQTAASKTQAGRGNAASQQPTPPPRPAPWWADEKSKKELGLTPDQVKQIDDIYNSAKDELSADREAYDRERKELDKMIAESKLERWVVQRQIDKMETARSTMNKLWFMTLYRMHQQLTPDQRLKLQQMADRDRGRGGRGGDLRDPKPVR